MEKNEARGRNKAKDSARSTSGADILFYFFAEDSMYFGCLLAKSYVLSYGVLSMNCQRGRMLVCWLIHGLDKNLGPLGCIF